MPLLCITDSPGNVACVGFGHSQNLLSREQVLCLFYKWDEDSSGAGHLILETFSSSHFPVATFDASDFFLFKHTFLLLAQPFHMLTTSVVCVSCGTFHTGVTQGNLPLRACRGLGPCLLGHPSHVVFFFFFPPGPYQGFMTLWTYRNSEVPPGSVSYKWKVIDLGNVSGIEYGLQCLLIGRPWSMSSFFWDLVSSSCCQNLGSLSTSAE